jgi:ribosomal protein S18 acetylase RimI-like enzyme
MARDPERKDKGAVRAVIEPFIVRAKEERMPIWLSAANTRARDVYAHFGFRVIEVFEMYPKSRATEVEGIKTWCMVANWPPE